MLTIVRAWHDKQHDGRIHYIIRDNLDNEWHLLADQDGSPHEQSLYRVLQQQMRLQRVQE
jgi:hypothetical protein